MAEEAPMEPIEDEKVPEEPAGEDSTKTPEKNKPGKTKAVAKGKAKSAPVKKTPKAAEKKTEKKPDKKTPKAAEKETEKKPEKNNSSAAEKETEKKVQKKNPKTGDKKPEKKAWCMQVLKYKVSSVQGWRYSTTFVSTAIMYTKACCTQVLKYKVWSTKWKYSTWGLGVYLWVDKHVYLRLLHVPVSC